MRDSAEDMKCIGAISLDPYDFIALTVSTGVREFCDAERADTRTLDEYNTWALAGKIRIPPFLSVDIATGKVLGHEGRHRAAALMAAGGRTMRVAIRLWRNGYVVNRLSGITDSFDDYHTFLGVEHLPTVLIGQFRSSVKVGIATTTFKPNNK